MFIAEQNMVGTSLGLARLGYVPFASTFAAFFTRAFDQIRMGALSQGNIKLVGSHAGVSIGEDGASQMALEDLAMMRAVHGSTIFYPSDAISTERLLTEMVKKQGVVFMRTTRMNTPVIYKASERFEVGGSKVVRRSNKDKVTLVGAGVTLHQSIEAAELLAKDGIAARVIDCYSVKPIDQITLKKAGRETKGIVVTEDHWFEGGLGDAVLNVFAKQKNSPPIIKLAVTKMPHSGKPEQLLRAQKIDAQAIVKAARQIIR